MLQGYRLVLATTFMRRLQGLLFNSYENAVLLISPCKSIHTLFLSYPLDVAFIDQKGVVIRSEREVGRCFMMRDRKALAVLERKTDDSPWPQEGDQVFATWIPKLCDQGKHNMSPGRSAL